MDVELYVYDLSKGLARQMSAGFLGVHIDAVYHTAIVFGGIEYFFGAGVQTTYPGATHHGRPMEVIPMGRTDLPLEIILEYLESLKQVYTAEAGLTGHTPSIQLNIASYDLFLHNCNNFSNDFAMFLVGKNIPNHITSLPQTVLNTPFGQMLKPQLDQAMRGITQAPVAPAAIPRSGSQRTNAANGPSTSRLAGTNGASKELNGAEVGNVHSVTQLRDLERLLESAKKSCAVIFFTSATCPPCKIVYPAYDELAAEAGKKAVLVKVDISRAHEIGSKYQVRATPTFMSFLRGEKENEWVGANPSQLRGNVHLLIQMAYPPHPHSKLKLPTLQRQHSRPITFAKVPPLEKLTAKLGPAASDQAVVSLKDFVAARQASGAADAPLPALPFISSYVEKALRNTPPASLFPLIDLVRLALVDPRVTGYFAEESPRSMILAILSSVVDAGDDCPYTARIVTVQLACNLFTSSLFANRLLTDHSLSSILFQLVTSSLLDETHAPIRVAAASLAFNIAAYNHLRRLGQEDDLMPENAQIELMASLLEAVGREESKEETKGLLLAIGLLAYGAPQGGELADLCRALGAKEAVSGKSHLNKELAGLAKEVESVVA